MIGLALPPFMQGDYEMARILLNQTLAIEKARGNTRSIALTLQQMARLETDMHKSRALIEQALALCRELGDTLGVATSLYQLSICFTYFKEYEQSRICSTECIALLRQLEEKDTLIKALCSLSGNPVLPRRIRSVLWNR